MQADDYNNKKLLKLFLENRCTPKELEEVMSLLKNNLANRVLLSEMQKDFKSGSETDDQLNPEQSSSIHEKLTRNISPAPVLSIKRSRWRVSVAAAILLIASGISLILFNPGFQKKLAGTKEITQPGSDIAPGGNKAILTLADGSTIVLDDAQNGALTQQGNTNIIKLNGKINYDASSSASGSAELLYNTIETPRGGQYQVELPDGSQVWLNAASSLRFPAAFVGTERSVEITGEVYFEIAKNKSSPFVVKVNNAEVLVLGTHFNVMAYSDEVAVKTTLLEGAVKFASENSVSTLVPGQQLQLAEDGAVNVINNVDVKKVVAWKNGVFNFYGEKIESITRQLARWYDVEIVIIGKIDGLFYAEDIPRNMKLSEVIKLLELTGEVNFKVEGRKVIVTL